MAESKIEAYEDKVYTSFWGLNVPGDQVECEPFIIISIDSSLVCKRTNILLSTLDNCAYENCKHTNDRLSWWEFFWVW